MAKRTGARTRTLGIGWEERFLAAVRKAREKGLVPPEQAEKLRRLAGAYFCVRCKQEHRTESALGKQHLRLQPASKADAAAEPAAPAKSPQPAGSAQGKRAKRAKPAAAKALPVELTEKAKAAGEPARAKLTKSRTATTQARLDDGEAKAPGARKSAGGARRSRRGP